MGPCTSHYLTLLCLLQQTAEGYDHSVVIKELKVSANGQYTIFVLGQRVNSSISRLPRRDISRQPHIYIDVPSRD